jgi:hypothetical protein
MLRPRVIAVSASLLTIALAAPVTAQRLEVAVRIGYSPPTGTLFQVGAESDIRSWDGSGLSIGAAASYWPRAHVGIQGTVDLRFARHYVTEGAWTSECMPVLCQPVLNPPVRLETSATQLVASLRLAARRALGPGIELSASLGPAMILFGHSEYQPGGSAAYALAQNYAYGIAGGLSAAYALSSRLRLTVRTDDAVFRVQPAAVRGGFTSAGWQIYSVTAPLRHQLTFSAAVSVGVP